MKLVTDTVHTIVPDSDETPFMVKVDADKTVQIRFGEVYNNDCPRRSQWLGRDDLLALRRAINKALSLI